MTEPTELGILRISFKEGLVLGIIKDARQKPLLVATLQMIGVRETKEFDVFKSAIRKKRDEEDEKQVKIRNIETIIQRVGACEKSSSATAKVQRTSTKDREKKTNVWLKSSGSYPRKNQQLMVRTRPNRNPMREGPTRSTERQTKKRRGE